MTSLCFVIGDRGPLLSTSPSFLGIPRLVVEQRDRSKKSDADILLDGRVNAFGVLYGLQENLLRIFFFSNAMRGEHRFQAIDDGSFVIVHQLKRTMQNWINEEPRLVKSVYSSNNAMRVASSSQLESLSLLTTLSPSYPRSSTSTSSISVTGPREYVLTEPAARHLIARFTYRMPLDCLRGLTTVAANHPISDVVSRHSV